MRWYTRRYMIRAAVSLGVSLADMVMLVGTVDIVFGAVDL